MSAISATTHDHDHHHHVDDGYDAWINCINHAFNSLSGHLFTTSKSDQLFDAYLAGFPEETRQYHNCHTCRRFIESYGGLVTVNDDGSFESAFWKHGSAPEAYKEAVANMLAVIHQSRITGVFLSPLKELGARVTGKWTHFAVKQPSVRVFNERRGGRTAHQSMAAVRENLKTVETALREYSRATLNAAMVLLSAGRWQGFSAVVGPVRWLHDVAIRQEATEDPRRRRNLLWRDVAAAPDGFCHPRSGMAGTLLDDILSGMSIERVRSRFEAKMNPLNYRRPTAPASAGNIAQAEKLVEEMGLAPALRRRFATPDEVTDLMWRQPEATVATGNGRVFGHLTPKGSSKPVRTDVSGVTATMTWDKFRRTVLPDAQSIGIVIERRDSFIALVTAADPAAPPLLAWDHEQARNPVNWYVYPYGSTCQQWGVSPGVHPVWGICDLPCNWNSPTKLERYGDNVIFLVRELKDTHKSGLALFPSVLRGELHSVSSVIEDFSTHGELDPVDGPVAAGVCGFAKGRAVTLHVTTRSGSAKYLLDRFD